MLAYQLAWGSEFKRLIRAAAALRDLFDDQAIASAVGRSRNTVAAWWRGSSPEPETLRKLADATGLDPDRLFAYVYRGEPPPLIGQPGSPTLEAVEQAARLDRERQPREAP